MDARELRAEIQRVTGPKGRRHFSGELRARVKAAVRLLRKRGSTQTAIAETLGISQVTVGRYLRSTDPQGTTVRAVAVHSRAAKGSRVTTPSGFEVEGLGVEEIAELIRALS